MLLEPTMIPLVFTIGSTFAGAITVAFFITAWENRLHPTELIPIPQGTYSSMFMLNGHSLIIGGIALSLVEILLLTRSVCKKACFA